MHHLSISNLFNSTPPHMQENKIEGIKIKVIFKVSYFYDHLGLFSLTYQLTWFLGESVVIAEDEKLWTKLRRSSS